MGIPIGGGADAASQFVSGVLTSAVAGPQVMLQGNFNIVLWGTFVGAVVPERSFDGGTTFLQLTFSDGTPVAFTTPVSATWSEPESGVIYRVRCSAFTSGTINWRLSR
jgi:hypothetical protein